MYDTTPFLLVVWNGYSLMARLSGPTQIAWFSFCESIRPRLLLLVFTLLPSFGLLFVPKSLL